MFRQKARLAQPKTCTAMSAPQAPCPEQCPGKRRGLRSQGSYCLLPCTAYNRVHLRPCTAQYHTPLTTKHRLLPCTACYHAPLTTKHRLLPSTAYYQAPLTTMHRLHATMPAATWVQKMKCLRSPRTTEQNKGCYARARPRSKHARVWRGLLQCKVTHLPSTSLNMRPSPSSQPGTCTSTNTYTPAHLHTNKTSMSNRG